MYQPISSLDLPDHKIQELQSNGYFYTKDLDDSQFQPELWNHLTSVPQTKTALDVCQEENVTGTISAINKDLDEALGGGIPIGLITEFCGEPGSGKTQMCFQLCVNVQLPKWCGGTEGEAVYITTNKGFASHRLKEIAAAYVENYQTFRNSKISTAKNINDEFNVNSILSRVYSINIDDHIELIATIKYLETWLKEHSNVRLVVIDTISAPLKLLEGQERTQVLYSLLNNLQKLAQRFNFAIVLTNDMTTRIVSTNEAYFTPSLGGSYYHRINIRVQLSRKSDSILKACVIKNIFKAPTEVEFGLSY